MEGLCVDFSMISFSSFHFCIFHSCFKSTHGLQQSQCKRGRWRCLLSRQAGCGVPTLKKPSPGYPGTSTNILMHLGVIWRLCSIKRLFSANVESTFEMFDLKLMMKLSCPVTLLQSVGLRALDKDLCPRHSYLCTWGPDAMHKCALPGRQCAHIVVGSCSCHSEKYCKVTLRTIRKCYWDSSKHIKATI